MLLNSHHVSISVQRRKKGSSVLEAIDESPQRQTRAVSFAGHASSPELMQKSNARFKTPVHPAQQPQTSTERKGM